MKNTIRILKHSSTGPIVPPTQNKSAASAALVPPTEDAPFILAIFNQDEDDLGGCTLNDNEFAALQHHAASKKIEMDEVFVEMVDQFLASLAAVEKNLRPTGGAA